MNFIEYLIKLYLDNKAYRSRIEYNIHVKNNMVSPLPKLEPSSPNGMISVRLAQAVNKVVGELKYTSDPMNGLIDYYNHPEHTQWRKDNEKWAYPCDCDDFTRYALGLFNCAGVYPGQAWEWNLIIDPLRQIEDRFLNHVICGFRHLDGKGQEWVGVIDTNTAGRKKIFWHKGTKDTVKENIKEQFNGLYNVKYSMLIESGNPFYAPE